MMEIKLSEITNQSIMNMTSSEFLEFMQKGDNCTCCIFWIDDHFNPFGVLDGKCRKGVGVPKIKRFKCLLYDNEAERLFPYMDKATRIISGGGA